MAKATSWIVTRRELKDTPRVRAFIDFLVPYVQADQEARGLHIRACRRTGRRQRSRRAAGLPALQVASLTSILPLFSPAIRPMSASGAAAMPSRIVSWYFTFPAFSQPAMSRWKSG